MAPVGHPQHQARDFKITVRYGDSRAKTVHVVAETSSDAILRAGQPEPVDTPRRKRFGRSLSTGDRRQDMNDQPTVVTREQLALLLENEAHHDLAERIRAGSDPVLVLGDDAGGLRRALRSSRYDDEQSHHARGTFTGIVTGAITIRDEPETQPGSD